jgi:hypothetical protein
MYTVEDDLFQRARSVIALLARELTAEKTAGATHRLDLHDLVRRSTEDELPPGGEADYLQSIADGLARSFPISELFPRRHRTRSS